MIDMPHQRPPKKPDTPPPYVGGDVEPVKPLPPPTVIIREHGYVGLVIGVAVGLAVIAAFVLGRLW